MQRHSSRLLLGGCILIVLSGCGARQWPPFAEYMSGNGKPAGTSAQNPSSSTSSSRSASAARAKPATPASAAEPIAINSPFSSPVMPDRLSGLNEQEARKLLGAPTEVENKAPAKIWRYREEQCALDVSFYPDVQTRVFRILSYEVTGYDGTDQRKHQCWPELRAGAKSR